MAGPTALSGGVFISYRRRDTAPYARLLREELSRHPSTGRVFMDVDSIEVGVDFAEAIERAVGTCEVLLALVGPQWLTITDADGQRRLDDPDDTVRLEIEAALQRDIRVIPVLVDNTPMPRRQQLPPSLAPLARRNALELSYDRYAYDLGRLLKAVEKVLGHPAGPAPTRAPARSRGATGTQRSAGSTTPTGGTGSQRVVQLLKQGEASIRRGSDDEAFRVADQALQLDPDNKWTKAVLALLPPRWRRR